MKLFKFNQLIPGQIWAYDLNPTIINLDYLVYAVFSKANQDGDPVQIYEICLAGNLTFYIDSDTFNRLQSK